MATNIFNFVIFVLFKPSGSYYDDVNQVCLQKKQFKEICQDDTQCSGYLLCNIFTMENQLGTLLISCFNLEILYAALISISWLSSLMIVH